MSRTTRFTATVAAAGIVAAGFMGPASAAPSNKGTTYVVPSATTNLVLVDVARPGSLSDRGAGFGIVGNPNDGTIEHVGGLFVETLHTGKILQLRNFTIDLDRATVSGVATGFGRVDLFTFAPNDEGSVDLFFTETASFAVSGDVAAIAGVFAGTATIDR
ncbi:MAG: hypothetical protein ACQERF_10805 [Actinomycetota bacterium]